MHIHICIYTYRFTCVCIYIIITIIITTNHHHIIPLALWATSGLEESVILAYFPPIPCNPYPTILLEGVYTFLYPYPRPRIGGV